MILLTLLFYILNLINENYGSDIIIHEDEVIAHKRLFQRQLIKEIVTRENIFEV